MKTAERLFFGFVVMAARFQSARTVDGTKKGAELIKKPGDLLARHCFLHHLLGGSFMQVSHLFFLLSSFFLSLIDVE